MKKIKLEELFPEEPDKKEEPAPEIFGPESMAGQLVSQDTDMRKLKAWIELQMAINKANRVQK